jgi:TetR/AcrR family transcriptional repressor of nem operon
MRYKEYNPNKVLEKAIELFWKNGVNGCSINDLVEHTGVNRFSLYNEFENKQGILYASFNLYRERFCNSKFSILNNDGNLINILIDFFMSFLEDTRFVPGCYIIHVGTELADSDQLVKENLNSYLNDIDDLFSNLLLRHGRSEANSKFLSKHLLGLYCTAMSFCLIHTREEQEQYLLNGIQLILSDNG